MGPRLVRSILDERYRGPFDGFVLLFFGASHVEGLASRRPNPHHSSPPPNTRPPDLTNRQVSRIPRPPAALNLNPVSLRYGLKVWGNDAGSRAANP